MPDYTDVVLRYEPGSDVARLVFDGGTRVLRWPVTPELTDTRISSAQQLTDALAAGEKRLRLDPGYFVGNFKVTQPVTLLGDGQATLVPATETVEALTVAADDVTVNGVTCQLKRADRTLISVGSQSATSAEQQPHRVRFVDCTLKATPSGGHRGFALHGSDITVERCSVEGFLESGRDSQAIWVNNGPGPYQFLDSYLEASGENIMFGGAPVNIPNCVPSDVLIRGCTFFKPQGWKNTGGSVKNSIEVKNGQRITIEGNTIDGCWKDAQSGNVIVLTAKPISMSTDPPMPWCIVDDITIRQNIVRNCKDGFVVNILGHSSNGASQQTKRITIEHNLFEDTPRGIMVVRGVSERLTIRNNTFPAISHTFLNFDGLDASGQPLQGVFTPCDIQNNVTKAGAYGIKGTGKGSGTPSLEWWSNGNYTMTGNVIEKGNATIPWPPGQTILPPGGLAQAFDAQFKYTPDPNVGY